MSYRIRKTAERLQNDFFPETPIQNDGQGSLVPEELNEELEILDQENHTPGTDNIVIDKNNNPGDKFVETVAKLKNIVILVNSNYARDLINTTIAGLLKKYK